MAGSIFKNFFSLSLVQVVNQLVPLVAIPVVLRVIGLEEFGRIAFVQSLAIIMSGLVDYGFSFAATRTVAVKRNDVAALSAEVSIVLSAKLMLLLLGALLMGLIFILLPAQTGGLWLYFGAMMWVAGNALWPQWFFVGIERMHWITLINFFSKLLFFAAVLLLLRQPGQGYMLLLFFGLSNVLAALAAFGLMRYHWGIHFYPAGLADVIVRLRRVWPLFVSTASTTSLVNSNMVILGLFVQGQLLGLFGVAEKILLALQQLLSTFSQATYPALCNTTAREEKSERIAVRFFVRNYLWFIALYIFILMAVFALAPVIMELFGGADARGGAWMLKGLLPVAMLILFNIIPAQLLLAYRNDSMYRTAFLVSALVNLMANFSLAPWLGVKGTMLAMIFTHLVLDFMLWKAAILYFRPAGINDNLSR